MAFGMRDVFVADPLPQNGWSTTPAMQIENEEEKKKLFGIELAKGHPNPFEAGCAAFNNETALALWASNNWLNDPVVIASRDLYANTIGVQDKLLDKDQTALKLLNIAEEKLGGRYLAEAKDRLKALELYSKLRGYMSDALIDNSRTFVNNEIKVVLVKPQQQEEQKTIDLVPTPIDENPSVSIKLVKSA
jgi:hypothetical protein